MNVIFETIKRDGVYVEIHDAAIDARVRAEYLARCFPHG